MAMSSFGFPLQMKRSDCLPGNFFPHTARPITINLGHDPLLLFWLRNRPMGLNNTPAAAAILVNFRAVPPHLGFARIRDVIKRQNSRLSADLDLGADDL